jgi:integrase
MGWAEPRGPGQFRAAYRATVDGKSKQLYVKDEDTGETLLFTSTAKAKRAADVAEDKERNRAKTLKATHATGTFRDWVNELHAAAPSTESALRVHVLPQWGDVPLLDINDREDVQEWVEALSVKRTVKHTVDGYVARERALSAGSVHRVFYTFSGYMKKAVKRNRIPFTPCQYIDLPTQDLPDERFLTVAEFSKIYATAPDDDMRLFCDLGVGTGFRFGEMVGLHRHRIDTDHKSIVVQETWSNATGEMKGYPKSKKRRGVPIDDELSRKLEDYMRTHPAVPCREQHVDSRGNTVACSGSLLLSRRDGHAWTHSNTQKLWSAMLQAAGVGHVRIHDMRHTYASWLIQRGISKDELCQLLGHYSVIVTERYAHLAGAHWGRVRAALGNTEWVPPTPEPPSGLWIPAGSVASESAPQLLPATADDQGAKIIQFPPPRRSAG